MKKRIGIMLCAGLLPASLYAQSTLTTEQRFALLEQRLLAAERRADNAESEIRALKKMPPEQGAVALAGQASPQAVPTHAGPQGKPSPAFSAENTPALAANVAPLSAAENTPAAVTNTATAAGGNNTGAVGEIKKPLTLTLNGNTDLKLYGDVEFNVDAASRSGSLTAMKGSDGKSVALGSQERWDVNGRLLIGLDGYRRGTDDRFSGFSVQPLANVSGGMGLDDAVFFFGQENNWKAKVGRYEAFDMFPLNQDTFVEYSGNTANDLYDDGYGYIYMMKEGRGRSSSGGALQLSKTSGPLYFELNALAKDGTTLFNDDQYHGYGLENKKNVVYLRPVAALTVDAFTAALAMESNVVSNAYGYYDASGRFHDQSKRTGYGATFSWNGQRNDPQNGTVVNLSTAYLDAEQEQDFSAGINALWRDIELGYIYAHNDIKAFNYGDSDNASGEAAIMGKYSLHTLHSSYRFRNVMDMENFNVYLGAYWSRINIDNKPAEQNDKDRYGMRVRFKYFF
ncbi:MULTISPECIES: carbohydrate porin [unclassified Erwinia]|uniref:carbohydrate porin n=1 Tax=unclassified Erwinia TaxID=2622719 RepID=UPI0006F56ADE|nr:porin [Erwinia sp. Leaf53]PLV54060.1 porin [Erwinia sp. B116]